MMETLKQIEEIMNEYKELEPGSLTGETTFEELELDSLDLVDMAMACEDKFGVTVEISEDIKTVGDLMKVIDEQKG